MKPAKERWISILLRLYPVWWRSEYGPELHDILLRRRVSAGTVLDVLFAALTERWRSGEAWLLVGMTGLTINAVSALVSVTFGLGQKLDWSASASISTALLLVVGAATVMRNKDGKPRPGWAATRTAMLCSIPLLVLCLLMLSHILPVIVSDQMQVPGRHFAFVLYDSYQGVKKPAVPVLPSVLLISLAVNLPLASLLGVAGGLLGRGIQRFSQGRATRNQR